MKHFYIDKLKPTEVVDVRRKSLMNKMADIASIIPSRQSFSSREFEANKKDEK